MKRELSLELVNEFDGMLTHSHKSMSNNTTYCVLSSNLTGKYIHNGWLIYSNKPSGKFGFLESIGKIQPHGEGSPMPVIGRDCLYISETGWHSVSTNKTGRSQFYVLDLFGNIRWESNLDDTHAIDVMEVSNNHILILSSSGDTPEIEFLWKLDTSGQCIWKVQLDYSVIPPLIDNSGNIYVKHGSKISKLNSDGLLLWNIELGSMSGVFWENVICNNNRMYYGFQLDRRHFIVEFDTDGNIIDKYTMPTYTLYPVLEENTNTMFFIMEGTILVAFDIENKKIKHQVELKKYTSTPPIFFNDYVILCYEKQVHIYKKDLTFVHTYRLKGTVEGMNITEDNVLQILASDYQSWARGKSDICYSRLYELSKRQ